MPVALHMLGNMHQRLTYVCLCGCPIVTHNVSTLMFGVVQVLPFLAPFVGPGRLFNFLIRNHWHSGEAIAQLGQLPVLLLSSVEVRCPLYYMLHNLEAAQLE